MGCMFVQVMFRYDSDVFSKSVEFDPHVLIGRFREVAFLNGAARLYYRFRDGKVENDEWMEFHYEGGLKEYVEWLNKDRTAMHAAIAFARSVDDVQVMLV